MNGNPSPIDYSKCLGKVNTTVEVTDHGPVTMDGKMFMNFVGDGLVDKLKSYDAVLIKEGFDSEFLALHKIWSYLGKPSKKENGIENNKNHISVESEIPNAELKKCNSNNNEPLIKFPQKK